MLRRLETVGRLEGRCWCSLWVLRVVTCSGTLILQSQKETVGRLEGCWGCSFQCVVGNYSIKTFEQSECLSCSS